MKYPDDFINKIICGDCLDYFKFIPDKSIDLILCDPPYGINAGDYTRANTKYGASVAYCKDYGLANWDKEPMSDEQLIEIFRISKNQIMFGGNYFNVPPSSCWIVWDKDNGDNGYADCELAWTSFKFAVRKFKYRWQGMLQEKMGRDKEIRFHPTQKPLALFKWILDKYSNPGDLVLDPFLGSGTTAVACKELDRDYIGIEISPEYCAIAEKRVNAVHPKLGLEI